MYFVCMFVVEPSLDDYLSRPLNNFVSGFLTLFSQDFRMRFLGCLRKFNLVETFLTFSDTDLLWDLKVTRPIFGGGVTILL